MSTRGRNKESSQTEPEKSVEVVLFMRYRQHIKTTEPGLQESSWSP